MTLASRFNGWKETIKYTRRVATRESGRPGKFMRRYATRLFGPDFQPLKRLAKFKHRDAM